MSRIIATAAIRGAHACVARAEKMLSETEERHGRDKAIGFEATAYALPVTLALLGKRVMRLGDLDEVLQEIRRWLPPIPDSDIWLPYLGGALDAGAATLIAHETVEALKPLNGHDLVYDYWLGPTADGILRERGSSWLTAACPALRHASGRCLMMKPPNDSPAICRKKTSLSSWARTRMAKQWQGSCTGAAST